MSPESGQLPAGRVAGAVLCGGASRRMGRDKALVQVDGIAMVLRVAASLAAAGCEPVRAIGGDRPALESLGLAVVADGYPGEGPLGGVISALADADLAGSVMVVSCDVPWLTEATVREVIAALAAPGWDHGADVAVARSDRLQPMCAAWRPSVLPRLRQAFEAGERRLSSVLATLRIVEVAVNPQDLANVNTPGDLPQ
ncbi:MAG: molybdenum cofactor guanylyltransferase [Ilumatobacteraceae bacterium]